jgi:hypothetical protein
MKTKSIGEFLEEVKKIPICLKITTSETPNTVTEIDLGVNPDAILVDNRDSGHLYISFDGVNFKEIAPFTTIWLYNTGVLGASKIWVKSEKSLNTAEVIILY